MASIRMKLYSASLKTRTNVNILVPTLLPDQNGSTNRGQAFADYYNTHGNYPVLYLLHGTYGDEGDWQRYSRIEDYARTRNIVVVMPYGENSFYLDTESGKNYETYLTQELPQIIQWMFPVSKKWEDTFIAGLSMGGSAAVRLGLSHPDLYGYIAGLSSAFTTTSKQIQDNAFTVWSFAFEGKKVDDPSLDCFALAKRVMESKGPMPKMYLGVGTDDFLYQENCQFDRYLNNLGMEHVFSTCPGGNHNWNFWDPEILKVLDWLPINGESGTERKLGF